jgi:hypothetical protein
MKAYGGRADIAQIILKLGPKGRGMLSFTTPPLYPGIRTPDSYRIGEKVDPKTVRIFIETITLESNHNSSVFQSIA